MRGPPLASRGGSSFGRQNSARDGDAAGDGQDSLAFDRKDSRKATAGRSGAEGAARNLLPSEMGGAAEERAMLRAEIAELRAVASSLQQTASSQAQHGNA